MYVAEVEFRLHRRTDRRKVLDSVEWLAGALRKNGQALGREMPIVQTRRTLTLFLLLPAKDALAGHFNRWAKDLLRKIRAAGATGPFAKLRGWERSWGLKTCSCRRRSSCVLFTTYLDVDSSLRCGDCFLPVPLYTMKPWRNSEFGDVLVWEANYRACDTLYMNSASGEQFGLRQISDVESALSKEGRKACRHIEKQTGEPTYYYLFRGDGRSLKQEQARRCPSCNGRWFLKKTWLSFFDFRCKRCRLVSNVAWNVR